MWLADADIPRRPCPPPFQCNLAEPIATPGSPYSRQGRDDRLIGPADLAPPNPRRMPEYLDWPFALFSNVQRKLETLWAQFELN